eukprot:c53670_g1_i1 orf=1-276(-)
MAIAAMPTSPSSLFRVPPAHLLPWTSLHLSALSSSKRRLVCAGVRTACVESLHPDFYLACNGSARLGGGWLAATEDATAKELVGQCVVLRIN